ncbi:metal-dependent hydrolase [Acidobacteria bacterium AH-259-D05]|nr:metal-dependent hydrolase [Acidobacteria bacterium AH-259-D05]
MGHATFIMTTPGGKSLLIDPWVQHNPACPEPDKQVDSLDTMLITHAHFDHIQDAVELAKTHQPQIGCIYEIANWLERKGVQRVNPMNKGGSQQLNDVRVTMVDARHSCGILEDDGTISYGGEAAGYVVEFENGFRLYHAGDTCVFGDMKIISELYQPELILLPIGDLFTMSPQEAAYACRLLNAKKVIPMHYGTFPPLTGTPQELQDLTRELGTEVIEINPGEVLT